MAYLAEATRTGKQGTPILVKRNRQHTRIFIERPLNPVAVVGIYVEIQDAPVLVHKVADGQDRIVDIAKARGLLGAGMVQPPCDVKGNVGLAL